MAADTEIQTADEFASTMQQLVAEAERVHPLRSTPNGPGRSDPTREEFLILNERVAGLGRMLANVFERLTPSHSPHEEEMRAQMQRMEEHVVAIRTTESVNQRLFNSLHQELKSYRDNFLRDTLQKPFIRDLVVLFDDLSGLAAQMDSAGNTSAPKKNSIRQWHSNLENAIHSLLEILHRMEVTEIEPMEKVDRTLHRVVSYEPAEFAEDDGRIVMRVKRGFLWHDQVLRPEEVVAKRFG